VLRNAALGLGDSDDRTHPDRVVIAAKEDNVNFERTLTARFSPIHVRQIQMSKLHTGELSSLSHVFSSSIHGQYLAVVTSESSGNLRVCGFGSGGR